MKQFVFIILLSWIFNGCLNSPLLNHADADSADFQKIQETSSECPLEFIKLSLCADIEWIKMPNDLNKGEYLIKFYQKNIGTKQGPYVNPGYLVTSKLWMPSMGHGSAPVNVSEYLDLNGNVVIGIYHAKDVFFVMPGKWEIWVQLKKDKTIIDQAKIDINI